MLTTASKKDQEKSENFYKLVKYVKKHIDNKKDSIVHDFTVHKGLDPDLIDIPEEF